MTAHPAIRIDEYRPGACNIGPAEIARRRRDGLVMAGITLIVAVALVGLDLPVWTRLLVFPLAAAAIVTLEQARRRFCVGFAVLGLRNFGAPGAAESVVDPLQRAADRRTAAWRVLQACLVAALITAAFLALPV